MVDETSANPVPAVEILMIEDEGDIRNLIRHYLEVAGFHVLAVATGEEAVKAFQQHGDTIRLVLTDVVLPGGMDGQQTMIALLALRSGLPFCVMTGNGGNRALT